MTNDYIYTCLMETSFQQTTFLYLQILKVIVVVYTIKTGISNIWQLSGGGLLILPRWRQLRQQLVIRSIDGLLMKKKIVGDFVSSSKVVGTWCRVL